MTKEFSDLKKLAIKENNTIWRLKGLLANAKELEEYIWFKLLESVILNAITEIKRKQAVRMSANKRQDRRVPK